MIGRRLLRCGAALTSPVCRGLTASVRTGRYSGLLRQTSPIINTTPSCALHRSCHLQNDHIINIQDEDDFKTRVTESSKPVIVDFHATWCGPCKLLGPKLEAVISKNDGDVIMAKVDIDDNTNLAMEYGVEAVPTVLGVKNGKVVDKFVGVKMDDELDSFVRKLTGN